MVELSSTRPINRGLSLLKHVATHSKFLTEYVSLCLLPPFTLDNLLSHVFSYFIFLTVFRCSWYQSLIPFTYFWHDSVHNTSPKEMRHDGKNNFAHHVNFWPCVSAPLSSHFLNLVWDTKLLHYLRSTLKHFGLLLLNNKTPYYVSCTQGKIMYLENVLNVKISDWLISDWPHRYYVNVMLSLTLW